MSLKKLFGNIFKAGQQATHEINEAVEDAMGTDIIEVDIRNAKETIRKVNDEMAGIQAKVDLEKDELDLIKEEMDRMESEIDGLKALHEKEEDEAKKAEIFALAQDYRAEINKKLQPKYDAKKEAFEMATASLETSKKLIEDQKQIIEEKELSLSRLKANQGALEVHKQAEKLANSIGTDDGTGSADRLEKRQKEQMRKIQIKAEQSSSKDKLASRLDAVKNSSNSDPW